MKEKKGRQLFIKELEKLVLCHWVIDVYQESKKFVLRNTKYDSEAYDSENMEDFWEETPTPLDADLNGQREVAYDIVKFLKSREELLYDPVFIKPYEKYLNIRERKLGFFGGYDGLMSPTKRFG